MIIKGEWKLLNVYNALVLLSLQLLLLGIRPIQNIRRTDLIFIDNLVNSIITVYTMYGVHQPM